MIEGLSGAVLAGGRSRRFGSDKALAPWGRATLVESVCGALSGLFGETLLVVKTPAALARLERPGLRVVADAFAEHHALGGIYSALAAAATERVFVCACDMPFLSPGLVEALCRASEGFDAAVPVWEGKLQPLCAVYSKACLAPIERLVAEDRLAARELFARVRARVFSQAEARALDAEGRSFVDLDTAAAYAAALARP